MTAHFIIRGQILYNCLILCYNCSTKFGNNPVKPAFIWLISARQMLKIARNLGMKKSLINTLEYQWFCVNLHQLYEVRHLHCLDYLQEQVDLIYFGRRRRRLVASLLFYKYIILLNTFQVSSIFMLKSYSGSNPI